MGYKLEAFLLNPRGAALLPDGFRHLHRFPLSDHVTLVPVTPRFTKEVVATFGPYRAEDDPYADSFLMMLLPPMIRMAVRASSVSAVLYVEVDVASGIGDRSAIVWRGGEAVYGPTWGTSQVAEAFRLFGELEGLPSGWARDLNIYRHRVTEDWVPEDEGDGA